MVGPLVVLGLVGAARALQPQAPGEAAFSRPSSFPAAGRSSSRAFGVGARASPRLGRTTRVSMVGNLLENLPLAQPKTAMPEVPEALKEPGLKVPATAWKWPRSWPYASEKLEPFGEVAWADKAVFDDGAVAQLRRHLVRHVPSRAERVLEIVGTSGVVEDLMPANGGEEEIWFAPTKVDRLEARALEEAKVLPYEDQAFDAVVVVNGAELWTEPRAAFREVFRVLKPGGTAIVAFSSARCSPAAHANSMTKTWRDYNDAQRIWVVGSYFHFSAGAPPQATVGETGSSMTFRDVWGAGWRQLKGFDYDGVADATSSPESSDEAPEAVLAKSSTPVFVVQAERALPVQRGEGPAAATDAALWCAAKMEEDDKRLCATRILAAVEGRPDAEEQAAKAARALPVLYETLQPMAAVIATPLLAQLAANLALRWDAASTAQMSNLREALGVKAPQPTFWKPLGEVTPKLSVDDKLWLLVDLLPFFKTDEPPAVIRAILSDQDEEGTVLFEGALNAALRIVEARPGLGSLDDQEKQLVATDYLAREYLPAAATAETLQEARDAADKFAQWLETQTDDQIATALKDRRDFRDLAAEAKVEADLDPEQAKAKAQAAEKAQLVENMLSAIQRRQEVADAN